MSIKIHKFRRLTMLDCHTLVYNWILLDELTEAEVIQSYGLSEEQWDICKQVYRHIEWLNVSDQ